MKKLNYIIIIAVSILSVLALASCNKQDAFGTTSTLSVTDPEVVSWKAYPVYAGSHQQVGFDVQLNIPAANVTKVTLSLENSMRWEVLNPTTGKYIMYDHISDFPTYAEGRWYHFEFFMKDGTVKVLPKFQVY